MAYFGRIVSWILPIVAVSAIIPGCGPTLEEGADARIRVTPPRQITFTRVMVGEARTMPFVVTSVGKDPLDVRRIEWTGTEAVKLVVDGNAFPQKLNGLASIPVAVEFTPTEKNPSPVGEIKIYSNDTTTPVYTLNVVAQQLMPMIHVAPSAEERLIFGQTEIGDTATRNIVVTNEGDLPLTVSKIALNTSKSFKYEIAGGKKLPVMLAANHATALNLTVSFTPESIGRDEGSIAFTSDDPQTPVYTLPIVANSDTPCLQIHPSLLEFSPGVSIGTSQTKTVLLTSCSDVPLRVTEVVQNGSELFSYELLNAGTELENGESAKLEVTFSPISEGKAQAVYTIINNDPLQPNALLSVMAVASSNQAPVAKAQGRLSSSMGWAEHLDLSPLDTVILDGSLSSDKESTALKYYWTVNKRPTDSTSKIIPNEADNGETASFFLDLAGDYELCLTVEDTDNMVSQNKSCVTVSAIPRETLHVQLVWHTPKDKTIGDGDGTDLDLHFMTLPDGKWGDLGTTELNNGTDVYYSNQSPVWPVPGYGNEEPSLDIDDKDGEGPENINLDHPAPCRWYAVGVHYYRDNGFGASYATVRIFVDGKMQFEKPNVSLSQSDMFKQVAWILWDGDKARTFEAEYASDGRDEWLGMTPVIPAKILEKAKKSSPVCFE